jgi:hypothetical protein
LGEVVGFVWGEANFATLTEGPVKELVLLVPGHSFSMKTFTKTRVYFYLYKYWQDLAKQFLILLDAANWKHQSSRNYPPGKTNGGISIFVLQSLQIKSFNIVANSIYIAPTNINTDVNLRLCGSPLFIFVSSVRFQIVINFFPVQFGTSKVFLLTFCHRLSPLC